METAPSTVRNEGPRATYGHAWMRRAVEGWTAADHSKAGARDELKSYLKAPLEITDDVVGW